MRSFIASMMLVPLLYAPMAQAETTNPQQGLYQESANKLRRPAPSFADRKSYPPVYYTADPLHADVSKKLPNNGDTFSVISDLRQLNNF